MNPLAQIPLEKHGPPSSLPCNHPTHGQTEAAPSSGLQLLLRKAGAELQNQTEWPFHAGLFPPSTLVVQLKECLPCSSSPLALVVSERELPWINKCLYPYISFWPLRTLFQCLLLGFAVLPASCTHHQLAFLFHLYHGRHII